MGVSTNYPLIHKSLTYYNRSSVLNSKSQSMKPSSSIASNCISTSDSDSNKESRSISNCTSTSNSVSDSITTSTSDSNSKCRHVRQALIKCEVITPSLHLAKCLLSTTTTVYDSIIDTGATTHILRDPKYVPVQTWKN